MKYSAVQYDTVQFKAIQYTTVQYSAVLSRVVQYSSALSCGSRTLWHVLLPDTHRAQSCCNSSTAPFLFNLQVKDSLREATLEARLAKHPAVAKAAAVRGEAMTLRSAARGENNGGRRMDKAKKASALWRMAEDIEAGAIVDILKRCGPCFGIGHLRVLGHRIPIARFWILSRGAVLVSR